MTFGLECIQVACFDFSSDYLTCHARIKENNRICHFESEQRRQNLIPKGMINDTFTEILALKMLTETKAGNISAGN